VLPAIAIGLLPGLAAAQGLGGVAREEASRRSQKEEARDEARTYTDADLEAGAEPGHGSEGAEADAGTGAAAAEAPDAAGDRASAASVAEAQREKADRLREDLDRARARRKELERKWRQRYTAAQAKLAAARKEHDAVCRTGAVSASGG
jgi:hypothetical protein